MPALLLAAVSSLALIQAAEPSAPDQSLDAIAATLLNETGSPGAAVSLDCGSGFQEGVAGLRIINRPALIEMGDYWHMGSNTKAMTATLAARLVEQGRIGWDTTVNDLLSDQFDEIDPILGEATLSQFLAHQSGAKPNAGLGTLLGIVGADTDRDVMQDRLTYARAILREAGGARGAYQYSNAGYVLAALMLEAAGEAPYETLIADEVFTPLGMTTANWGPPGEAGEADQPRGHRSGLFGGLSAREPGARADNPPALNPAGRAHMSLADLSRFLRAHADQPLDYLSEESWARLHAPVGEADYALGWGVRENGVLAHAGSNTMWFVQMIVDPATGCVAAAGVNDGRIDQVRGPVRAALTALSSAN